MLFQIVDPSSLWIEAYDYGDNDPATLEHATAIGVGNVAMKLSFQGWSRTLQQQATVLNFAISDPTSSLRIGQPVTVTAQRGETTTGLIIDRDAVVRGGNGETVVWRHVEPEYFETAPGSHGAVRRDPRSRGGRHRRRRTHRRPRRRADQPNPVGRRPCSTGWSQRACAIV